MADADSVGGESRVRATPDAGHPAAGAAARVAPTQAAIDDLVAAFARGEAAPTQVPNQVVARMLATLAATPSPVAAPAVTVGLASEQRIDEYAAQVRAFVEAPANQARPIVALARFAAGVANHQLAAIGVPVVAETVGTLDDAAAHFVSNDWKMTVDVSDFAPKDLVAPTVADIEPSKWPKLAGTVYHEARHAEQTFRQARLLAGRHHEELNPPTKAEPGDAVDILVLRAKLARMERHNVVLRLAINLVIPQRIMELAAGQPLISLDDPVTRLLGTVVYGLQDFTIADLFQPVTAYDRMVAAGGRGVTLHTAAFNETDRWWAQEALEDLVYDRSRAIGSALDALAAEARDAGGHNGMDIDAIRAQREPMKQIVMDIDRELKRLKGAPGRETMVDLLQELRMRLIEIGALIVDLVQLGKKPATPDRTSEIARKAEMVGLIVKLAELQLRGPMYAQLLLEADAYQQGSRVESAWGGATGTP